jgi:hypothetical protein
MPISPFLNDRRVDPEAKRVMSIAFEMAGAALRCSGQIGVRPGEIALTIIDLADAGERDPDRLCEHALKKLGHRPRRLVARAPNEHVAAT